MRYICYRSNVHNNDNKRMNQVARAKKNLNFRTRMYAAAYYIYQSGTYRTSVSQVAGAIGVSKTYARKLLEAWVNHGLIDFESVTYRSNSSKHLYHMNAVTRRRFEQMGYLSDARDCFRTNAYFNLFKQKELIEGMQDEA